ncbi:hypothetical protein [Bifidobacterium mongoliense]|uniref:Uncharacterized protein n=1 Tax=Bifidobacterium mongoliense DSM 21395 TaxID=1437603 RepID=A0A087BR30_9BIFI|nr:hypothetical protein [Bifidobacterium mongoliense]KFI73480.1 hypothetical protein BMON_1680 [Bifidobacterium mongoliense DSM 21395]
MTDKNSNPQDVTDEQLGHIIDHAYQAHHGGKTTRASPRKRLTSWPI